MLAFRSPLFVPGNREDMLRKALGMAPDALVPDLEDSVSVEEKVAARDTVASLLPLLSEAGPPVIPRVNSLSSGLIEDDLAAVVGTLVHGVSVPKVESAEDIERLDGLIAPLEQIAGVDEGAVGVIPWLETASGVQNAYEICRASARVVAVAFGAEDFARDMRIERTDEGSEAAYPRSAVCVAARAAGVPALDTPFVRFRETERLVRDCRAARRFGFSGKFAIHPSQIDVINREFAPSEDEIVEARRVVEAYESARRTGRGATSLDGKMVDEPVVARARDLLEMAQAFAAQGAGGG